MFAGNIRRVWTFVCIAAVVFTAGIVTTTEAAVISRIASTKHNLSTSGSGSVKASSETQICVFCHTPHGASATARPLWNRQTNAAGTYTKYTSSSLNATTIRDVLNGTTSGSSLLCLSCHDGTVAIGNIMVANGRAFSTASSADDIVMSGTASGAMPTGKGANTGYTRLLGTDLRNDHPISITYDDGLAGADGEMQRLTTAPPVQRDTISGNIIGIRASGYKPSLPLEPTGTSSAGQVQCASCHDPHLFDDSDPTRKFLRLNRYQIAAPVAGNFNATNDIICLACHTKLDAIWKNSAHATQAAANETYKSAPAATREFKGMIAVWEASCLNCHDTHTVQGARRLLREGTSDALSGTFVGGGYKVGATTNNNSAIEQTCYQCHSLAANSVISAVALTQTQGVPNIQDEFSRAIRMPIITNDQGGGGVLASEVHDITNADFIETATLLGAGATGNRHVECTDCHNPHRVLKNELFNGLGSMVQRTHVVGGTAAASGVDGNIASGALRGIWGVEPTYTITNAWPESNVSFAVKQGDPGTATSTARTQGYLTREYQLCFKCHSNYANSTTASSYPVLRGATYGGTASGINSMARYTNVAGEMSYNAAETPTTGTDQGEAGEGSFASPEDGTAINPIGSYPADTLGTGMTDSDTSTTQNHRSWHPVRMPTGRTRDERRMQATGGAFRPPFDTNVGRQTMHCSDCHGNAASWTAGTGPLYSQAQGPHGSTDNFLLKGAWSTGSNIGAPGFCGNCHTLGTGSGSGDGTARFSGFNNIGTDGGGGHANGHDSRSCMRCHVAVPHGWKNKALLVNLRCVGTEGGQATDGCNVVTPFLTIGPYYVGAGLRVTTWVPSGNWSDVSCGGVSWMQSNC